MHYPNIEQAFENPEHTFIAANAFKVSPVLEPNTTFYHSFFPNGYWINLHNFSDVLFVNGTNGGDMVNLTAPNGLNDTINVHLKPGSIITWQDNSLRNYTSAQEIFEEAPISLVIAPDAGYHAKGEVFFDNGRDQSDVENKEYEHYQFNYQQ
jgi:alpha-glucosidase (family GH31 glycosyl hydrolase)